jgi:hypothetical protein
MNTETRVCLASLSPPRSLLFLLLFLLLPAAGLAAPAAAASRPFRQAPPAAEAGADRISIEPVGDPAALRRQRLERWLPAYRREMPPVLEAFRKLRRALGSGSPSAAVAECRTLGRTLAGLDRGAVLPAPEFALHHHLSEALGRLTRGALACVSRRYGAVASELAKAQHALAHSADDLRRLGVEP